MSETAAKKRSSRRGGSPEMKAVQKTYQALKGLNAEQRVKVLSAVGVLMGEAPKTPAMQEVSNATSN